MRKQQDEKLLQSFLKRKQQLLKNLAVPEDALPGSLSVSRFRCGKKNCYCSKEQDRGNWHENWILTYMDDGAKKVKHIPVNLLDQVRDQVEQGRTFKERVNQVFAANAELLVLLRKRDR